MNKKTCAYIVLGTLGALFVGLFTYLNISVHGLLGGIAWTIGTFAFAWLLNKLIFTSIEWLVEADYEERKARLAKLEAEVEAECDKEFEEFKKQMNEAREKARKNGSGGIAVEVKNGNISVRQMTKEELAEQLKKEKAGKKVVKKPAKKTIKSKHIGGHLHTVKKGRALAK